MIRIRPIGLALAILFMLFGPHNWFLASSGSPPPQAQPSAVSPVLPDASSVGDRPTRGDFDAVQTKEGWKVRMPSERQMIWDTIIAAVIILAAWPLRQMAASRRNDAGDGEDSDS